MTVDVRDKKQLEKLVCAMRRISGVRDVERPLQLTMPSSTDPEHIAISKSKGIKIDWKDGHHSEYGLHVSARQVPLRRRAPWAPHGTPERLRRRRPARFRCSSRR